MHEVNVIEILEITSNQIMKQLEVNRIRTVMPAAVGIQNIPHQAMGTSASGSNSARALRAHRLKHPDP